jgi:hypothetical protein
MSGRPCMKFSMTGVNNYIHLLRTAEIKLFHKSRTWESGIQDAYGSKPAFPVPRWIRGFVRFTFNA